MSTNDNSNFPYTTTAAPHSSGGLVASPPPGQFKISDFPNNSINVDLTFNTIPDESRWMINVIGLRFFGVKNNKFPLKRLPFRHIHACYLDSDNVCIMVVVNGEPVLVKDTAAMFPSDALITQLRLLADGIDIKK